MRVNWRLPVAHQDFNKMPASVWIRCLQVIPYLAQLGIDSVINAEDTAVDVNVFVRWQDERAYQLALACQERGQRVIFDLVVNYFTEATLPYLGTAVSSTHIQQVEKMLTVADVVTCASQYIATQAEKHHTWVVYIPDSVDLTYFSCIKKDADFFRKRLRAVWSGVAVKAHELQPILPLLRRYGIQLVVISEKRPLLKNHTAFFPLQHYRFRRWRYQTFPQNIVQGEICLSPRNLDNSYNLGHSFFKIGVFMAEGVPVLASPIPSYQEVISPDNEAGRLCPTLEDWSQALHEITTHRELLLAWSQNSRQVMESYSTAKIADQYMNLFTQL